MSIYFAPHLGIASELLPARVRVLTPVGDSLIVDQVCRLCVFVLYEFESRVDLILLDIMDFNVILGMDWLSPQYAIVNYYAKTVTLSLQS